MNAKEHPDSQIAQIAASIQEFGMNDPVAIWHDKDKHPVIVEGHGRVLALQKLGIEDCPTIALDDLTDKQRRAYTLIHNQLIMNSGFDIKRLDSELADLTDDFDLDSYGFVIPDFSEDDIFSEDNIIPSSETESEYECPECHHMASLSEFIEHKRTA